LHDHDHGGWRIFRGCMFATPCAIQRKAFLRASRDGDYQSSHQPSADQQLSHLSPHTDNQAFAA
jgi:hypothetical protein